jgi:hypothetical protein
VSRRKTEGLRRRPITRGGGPTKQAVEFKWTGCRRCGTDCRIDGTNDLVLCGLCTTGRASGLINGGGK